MAIDTSQIRSLLLPGLLKLNGADPSDKVEFWRDYESDSLIVRVTPTSPAPVVGKSNGKAIRLTWAEQRMAIQCYPNVPQAVAFAQYARAQIKAQAAAEEQERKGRTPLILDAREVAVPVVLGRDLDL